MNTIKRSLPTTILSIAVMTDAFGESYGTSQAALSFLGRPPGKR
jgi:hypothetical protein